MYESVGTCTYYIEIEYGHVIVMTVTHMMDIGAIKEAAVAEAERLTGNQKE